MLKDPLIREKIEEEISGMGYTLHLFDEVTSTNTLLKQAAEDGCADRTVFLASSQTAGRGRMGRRFHSPDGCGIYMSILFRHLPSKPLRLTGAAGVAVCRALEKEAGIDCRIKWVNDVYREEKKLCGVLTEGAVSPDNGQLLYAIVGIGINVYPPEGGYPPDISEIATSVSPEVRPSLRGRLAVAILRELKLLYPDLDSASLTEEYRNRCFSVGRKILVLSGGTEQEAFAIGIDDEMHLLVRYPDGREESLSSGEISTRIR